MRPILDTQRNVNFTDQHIRERVESFVKDLETLIRQAAVASVAEVLGVGTGTSKQASPRMAAAPASTSPKAAPAAKVASRSRSASGGKGKRIRRTIAELDAIGARIQDYIGKNPGQGAEGIKKALKLGANDWTMPIKKLVDERRVTSKGKKRSTVYFAGK